MPRALFNLMRNLGGAIGIATVTTWLQDYGRIHGEWFGEAMANTQALGHAAARIFGGGFRCSARAAHAEGRACTDGGRTGAHPCLPRCVFLMTAVLLSALLIVPFCRGAVLQDGAPQRALII